MNYDQIKKTIRRNTKVYGSNRQCYISGTTKNIQNHHLYRVADLSHMCVKNRFYNLKELYIPLVDLGDRDHFMWHVLAEDSVGNVTVTPEKFDRIIDLMNEMSPLCEKVPEVLQDDYIDLHNHLCDTIEKNMVLNQDESITEEMAIKEIFDNDVFWGADRIPPEDEEIVSMDQIYFKNDIENDFGIAM